MAEEKKTLNNDNNRSNDEKILEVKDLRISFRTNNGTVKAVRGINFSLYRGRTLGIVGESGSGKSVTSRAILGILAGNKIIENGQILYDGRDLLSLHEEDFTKIRGSKIAMIFQDPMSSLNPLMKVGKQLTEAMVLKGKATKKEARKTVDHFNQLLLKHAVEAKYASKKEIKKLLDRWQESSLPLLDHVHPNDYPIVQEMFNICFNKEYSRYQTISDEDKKLLLECLLPSESTLLQDYEMNKSNRKLQRQVKQIKERREKVVESIIENIIDPKWALTEEEKQSLKDILKISVEIEYQRSNEKKNGTLSLVNNLLNDCFASYESFDTKKVKSLLKLIDVSIQQSQYVFAEYKDDIALTFVSTILGYLDEYNTSVDLLKKQRIHQEKADAIIAKGGKIDTLKERAYGREIIVQPESVFNKTKSAIENFINHYESLLKEEKFDLNVYVNNLWDYMYKCYVEAVHVISKRDIKNRAIELLGEVGIPEPEKRFDQYPFQFSGGMRQRIVIAIALSSNPDILICDEPTTALDVTIQSQILELINKLKEEKGLSIIFITHDLGVIANMADDIAVMYAGKIVEYGTVEDIFYDPRHPYTWALLSSMPDLNTKEKLEAIPGTPPNMILPPKGDAFAARNKYAMKIDFEEEPPLFKVNDTHYAATWLLHPNAPQVTPPKIVTERIRLAMERREQNNKMDKEADYNDK